MTFGIPFVDFLDSPRHSRGFSFGINRTISVWAKFLGLKGPKWTVQNANIQSHFCVNCGHKLTIDSEDYDKVYEKMILPHNSDLNFGLTNGLLNSSIFRAIMKFNI